MPQLSLTATGPSEDQRSLTPSGTIFVAEVIPSPPDSISSARARVTAGRTPISPGAAQPGMRFHLPFQWKPPSPRPSCDFLRDSPELSFYRHTPSPLVFAMPADQSGQGLNTTTISDTPDISERIYDAAPWLKDEKAYLRQTETTNARRHEVHEDDEDDDAISGPLRWVRDSGETASTVKSELEFARTPQRDVFGEEGRIFSHVDRKCCLPALSNPLYRRLPYFRSSGSRRIHTRRMPNTN